MGAALQGGVLRGDVTGLLLLDVTPLSLGIETLGGVFTRMIPKNTTVPVKISQRFATNSPNQQRIHVCILEGDAIDPDACTVIGDFRVLNLPPNLPAGSPVEITYEYDKNGRIGATARELTSNREAKTEIVRDSGLTTDGVDTFEILAKDYSVE